MGNLAGINWRDWLTFFVIVALAITSLYLVIDIAKGAVINVDELWKQLQKTLTPPKPDSWQSLVWISVFSWVTSLLPRSPTAQSLIATIGWLFLIPGLHWAIHEAPVKKSLTFNGFFIGPWITGALVCIFLFGALTDTPPAVAFICWPPISAIIASLPKFVLGVGPKYGLPNPAVRQELIILFLSNLLLSCWFQLYFSTQNWLERYPSLLADDLGKSSFVIQVGSEGRARSRGTIILEQAGSVVKETLAGKPWPQVERWLLDLDQQMVAVERQVMNRLAGVEENALWHLQGRILPKTEYTLQMQAVWQGPTVEATGYFLTKSCQMTKVADVRRQVSTPLDSSLIATIQCLPVSGPVTGQPEVLSSNAN